MSGSYCVLPELIAGLLVPVLADACDHETPFVYNYRGVLAMDSLIGLNINTRTRPDSVPFAFAVLVSEALSPQMWHCCVVFDTPEAHRR